MTKPIIPDPDETRAGFRSGEGTESVLRHLMSARRRQKNRAGAPDSHAPTQPSDDTDGTIDIQLPP